MSDRLKDPTLLSCQVVSGCYKETLKRPPLSRVLSCLWSRFARGVTTIQKRQLMRAGQGLGFGSASYKAK